MSKKKYGPEDIEVLGDAVSLIRKRPTFYFRDGRPTRHNLLQTVLEDACASPDGTAQIVRDGPWTLVCSDVDWMMSTQRCTVPDLFNRICMPEYRRPNCHRSEVMLTAAGCAIVTTGPAGDFALNLTMDDVPLPLSARAKTAVRALIWKFEDDYWSSSAPPASTPRRRGHAARRA